MSSKASKKASKKVSKSEHSSDDECQKVEKEEILTVESDASDAEKSHETVREQKQTIPETPKKVSENMFEVNECTTTKPVPTPEKSISEFDHAEVRKFDVKHTKDIDDMMLLKILLVRGKDGHNPALWSGSQRLLRQLNFEVDNTNRPPRNFGRNQPPRGRGGFQQRSQFQQRPSLEQRPLFQQRSQFQQHSQFKQQDDTTVEQKPQFVERRGNFERRDRHRADYQNAQLYF